MANKNKIRGPLSEEHRQRLIKSITGRVCSEETRQKISNSLKNKTRHPLSEEHRLKISKANKNKNTGPRSEEICQKISNGLKGRKVSEETRRKISETKTGYHYPEEVRIRMRDARRLKPSPLKGRSLSIEHCQKLSDSHKGQQNRLGSHPSEETRQKIRDSLQGRKLSKEHLKNMELSRTDDYKQKVSRSLKIFYANKNQTQKNLTYLNELLCLGQ